MTVDELRAALEGVEGSRIVVMSKDGEGNGYSPLGQLDDASTYTPDSTWSGEAHIEKLTDELRTRGYTEEDVDPDGQPALVLWPVN